MEIFSSATMTRYCKQVQDATWQVTENQNIISSVFPYVLLANASLGFPSPQELVTQGNSKFDPAINGAYLSYAQYAFDPSTTNKITTIEIIDQNGVTVATQTPATIKDGLHTATYTYQSQITTSVSENENAIYRVEVVYSFISVSNRYPTKPWTVLDCVKRVLDLEKPLFTNGINSSEVKPRYFIDPEQEEWLDSIEAPEFTMTRSTLREQLKVIGGFIHAEPRLMFSEDGTLPGGGELAMIHFDRYGGTEVATIQGRPYISRQAKQEINQYCTGVDSITQNMVNQLRYGDGTTTEPTSSTYLAQRTDSINIRVTDSNAIAYTYEPIQSIQKVVVGVYARESGAFYTINDVTYQPADITSFVFEKAAYDANLSSYDGESPYSKAYAIYYEQGTRNLGGLFYRIKQEDWLSAWTRSSIANILARVWGMTDSEARQLNKDLQTNYTRLAIQITYTPIYTSHVSHGKPYTDLSASEYVQIYNQQENLVETKYYGENIKGVAARLGNAEEVRTYRIHKYADIPKAGQLLDGMYISTVNISVLPTYFKVTVGLTKDFNRISEYVGISSNKRQYEVSERQVYERDVLIKEYCVITVNETRLGLRSGIFRTAKDFIAALFGDVGSLIGKIDHAEEARYVYSYNAENPELSQAGQAAQFPVISTALGNVAAFSWHHKDNYSIGTQTPYRELYNGGGNDVVEGYWQQDIPAGDYYGRAYWMRFSLFGTKQPDVPTYQKAISLPLFDYVENSGSLYGTDGYGKFLLRKDSREAIRMTCQIEAKTTDPDLIIGSELMSLLPLVSGVRPANVKTIGGEVYDLSKARMFFLDSEVNKFEISYLDLTVGLATSPLSIPITIYSSTDATSDTPAYCSFTVAQGQIPAAAVGCKAWVVALPAYNGDPVTYEDESGELVEVSPVLGGAVFLAKNTTVAAERITVRFTMCNDVFK